MGFPILIRWYLYIESGPCCWWRVISGMKATKDTKQNGHNSKTTISASLCSITQCSHHIHTWCGTGWSRVSFADTVGKYTRLRNPWPLFIVSLFFRVYLIVLTAIFRYTHELKSWWNRRQHAIKYRHNCYVTRCHIFASLTKHQVLCLPKMNQPIVYW